MRATIEPTGVFLQADGVRARLWEGRSAAGHPVKFLVTHVVAASDAAQLELERELVGADPPADLHAAPPPSLDDMTEPELGALMTAIARRVQALLPPDTGFLVLASPFGPHGIAQYVGHGSRADYIKWLRETADRLEAREDVPR